MMTIVDFHTHRQDALQALISVDPRHFDPQPGLWYSVGYHPWHGVELLTDDDYALLERCALHPQVLAIGETGMDRLHGPKLEVQQQAFVRHLHLAQELGKPVVAHCVRTAQDLLAARHHAALDDVTLIIHGMRGNEHIARTLLDAGCYLSYGIRYNPDALRATPLDCLLIETDDGTEAITDVAAAVAADLGLTADDLMGRVIATAQKIL
jgi:TatD DNase family protein